MGFLLSIDPASHGCGAALWYNGNLALADYVPSPTEGSGPRECADAALAVVKWVRGHVTGDEHIINDLALEYPQVYPRGANKTLGDPNKIVLPLVAVDAALCALFPHAKVHTYQPHDWKHGTSKPKQKDIGKVPYVVTTMVEKRLSHDELAAIHWPNKGAKVTKEDHKRSYDIVDAIGVGLHCLGRFTKIRVFARE